MTSTIRKTKAKQCLCRNLPYQMHRTGTRTGRPSNRTKVVAHVSAEEVVKGMYASINQKDVRAALEFIDDDILYEDLNFPEVHKGKEEVAALFTKSCESIPEGMDFIMDEISDGGGNSIGVSWHVEIAGIPFPNTRGCSFYRISPTSQKLVYARDVVESPLKPGEGAFFLLKIIVPLFLRLNSKSTMSTSLWALAAAYVGWLILSPPNLIAPGEPIWAIKPETLKEVVDESINFFYVNIILDKLGISPLPSPSCNPVSEALFNFVNAWSFMWLPVLLSDKKSNGLQKVGFWSVQMFLTNAILMPFLAMRASNSVDSSTIKQEPSKTLKQVFGITGGSVGLLSILWVFFGRPEYGDAASRIQILTDYLSHDRVSFAFGVDLILYSLFQIFMLNAVSPEDKSWTKNIPFIGMVRWLLL